MTNFRATNANISFKGRAPGQVFSAGDETIRDPPQEHSHLAVLRLDIAVSVSVLYTGTDVTQCK